MSNTFFDNKKNFKDVPITDNKVSTSEFLESAESLVKLFDLFGSSAFSPVQSDMTGNIKKIRAKQLEDPANGETLQDIVLSEASGKKKDATQGLLWLTRGLAFTAGGMRRSVNDKSEELATSFSEAYGQTLSKYHNMMIRPVFKMAMKACPYRKDFYEKLGEDQDKVWQQLLEWLEALEKIVAIIEEFLASGNYAKGL